MLIPKDYEVLESTTKVDSRTSVCDENYSPFFKISKTFDKEQIDEVVKLVNRFYESGINNGRRQSQREIREALGIYEVPDGVEIGDTRIYTE